MAAFFRAPARPDTTWFYAGRASSFPEVAPEGSEASQLSEPRLCNNDLRPGCKVFHVPRTAGSQAKEIELNDSATYTDLQEQVLVFQHRGKFHAMDHKCPHSSFPLSKGIPFDIEDFGVVLSAGIQCPKHNWSFDLFTGQSDRGSYRMVMWEVQMRPITNTGNPAGTPDTEDKEVWVRRKPRIG